MGTGDTNVTHFNTIAAAITALTGDGTIKLLNDITEDIVIPQGNTNHYTIDLKGQTLIASSGATIMHRGTGTLTIKASGTTGKVTSANANGTSVTICLDKGAVSNIANQAMGSAIFSKAAGAINMSDTAKVFATSNFGIFSGAQAVADEITQFCHLRRTTQRPLHRGATCTWFKEKIKLQRGVFR